MPLTFTLVGSRWRSRAVRVVEELGEVDIGDRARPSQRGHMPPARVKVCLTVLPAPRSIVIAPLARTEGTLKENAWASRCAIDQPLRLRGDRAEHQRALARARDAGEHCQSAVYLIGGVGRAGAKPVRLTLAGVALSANNQGIHAASARGASGPGHAARPAEASDQPAAVAGVAQPQPNGPGGGQVPAGRAVRRRGPISSASPSQSKDSGTRYGAPSAEALATQTSLSG